MLAKAFKAGESSEILLAIAAATLEIVKKKLSAPRDGCPSLLPCCHKENRMHLAMIALGIGALLLFANNTDDDLPMI